jgi:flavodoxin
MRWTHRRHETAARDEQECRQHLALDCPSRTGWSPIHSVQLRGSGVPARPPRTNGASRSSRPAGVGMSLREDPCMNVLVLFDTQFGNTEKIARAVGGALSSAAPARLQNARQVRSLDLDHVDLFIVGGPTQRQRITGNLEALLEAIPRRSLKGIQAAAFDTRYRMSKLLTGSAAARIERLLKKSGAHLTLPAESFFIERDVPPEGQKRRHEIEQLEPGELERAVEWAHKIAEGAALE